MKQINLNVASLLLSLLLISSCGKKDEILDNNTVAASDYARMQSYYSDMLNMSSQVEMYIEDPSFSITYNCSTLTLDTTAGSFYPVTGTLSFADQCISFDGRKRSGSVSVTITGPYNDPSTQVTVTCDTYSVNGNSVNGTLSITAPSLNGTSLITSLIISGGEAQLSDGTHALLDAAFTFEWKNYGDLDYTDDIFKISGNAEGTSTDGLTYNVSIPTTIEVATSCKYISTGVISITPEGLSARTIDFGNGVCDNDITVTIEGKEFVIQIRE